MFGLRGKVEKSSVFLSSVMEHGWEGHREWEHGWQLVCGLRNTVSQGQAKKVIPNGNMDDKAGQI